MTKAERRLLRLRNARNSSPYTELRAALLDAGFVEEAGRGSHRVFVHAQLRQFRVTLVERRGTMLPEYVADTLAAIDAVRTLARSGEPGDEIR